MDAVRSTIVREHRAKGHIVEMQVKIFSHTGHDATAELEKQINDWLVLLPAHGEMRHTSTAITVTDGKPSFVVAVWWQPHNGHVE
jgi:hypothetical protein